MISGVRNDRKSRNVEVWLALAVTAITCILGGGCRSLGTGGTTQGGTPSRACDKKAEDKLIKQLWQQTDDAIIRMGRPPRLYEINPARTAMVVVDMQEGFCAEGACIEIPSARDIVANINTLAAACRNADIPVYWIRLDNTSDGGKEGLWPLFQPRSPISPDRERPPVAFRDSGPATQIYSKLRVDPFLDRQVTKTRYSAFIRGSSDLERLLRKAGRDTLIVTGTGTDVCCESTARDAMMLDMRVIFVSDANATVSRLFHEVALMHIKMFFGDVVTTDDLLKDLKP